MGMEVRLGVCGGMGVGGGTLERVGVEGESERGGRMRRRIYIINIK